MKITNTTKMTVQQLIDYSTLHNLGLKKEDYQILISNGAVESCFKNDKDNKLIYHSCLLKIANKEDEEVANLSKKWQNTFEKMVSDPNFKGPIWDEYVVPKNKKLKYIVVGIIAMLIIGTYFNKAHGAWISSPVQYGADTTTPEELRELRKAVNSIIIPPYTQAISCTDGGQIDISYQNYSTHTKLWGDYMSKVESETYMRDAKNGELSTYNSHYYFNQNTIKIDDKHYLCIPKDTNFNKDYIHKDLNRNVIIPPKISLWDKFLNYFKG